MAPETETGQSNQAAAAQPAVVHIALAGQSLAHIARGLSRYGGDRVHVIAERAQSDACDRLRQDLGRTGCRVIPHFVDRVNTNEVRIKVVEIAMSERGNKVYVNTTCHHPLGSIEAAFGAQACGVQAYWVELGTGTERSAADLVKEILIHTMNGDTLTQSKKRILAFLLRPPGGATVRDLAREISRVPQDITHHLRGLRRLGLVRSSREGNATRVELTVAGRLIALSRHPNADERW